MFRDKNEQDEEANVVEISNCIPRVVRRARRLGITSRRFFSRHVFFSDASAGLIADGVVVGVSVLCNVFGCTGRLFKCASKVARFFST